MPSNFRPAVLAPHMSHPEHSFVNVLPAQLPAEISQFNADPRLIEFEISLQGARAVPLPGNSNASLIPVARWFRIAIFDDIPGY